MYRNLWFRKEIEQKIRQTIQSGMVEFDMHKGKLYPKNMQAHYDTNWMFFSNSTDRRDCYLWHTIMYNVFGLVPEFCRFHCWKVVVKPRNVRELIQLYQLVQAMPFLYGYINTFHGKCGIDTRNYTKLPYDAFFYNESKEEAYENYKIIRHALDTYLDPEIDAIVKRSCTEFERDMGPTDGPSWQKMTDEEKSLERYLESIYVGDPSMTSQPDWHRNKVLLHWLQHAYMHGDTTGVEFLGQDIHSRPGTPVTYHDAMIKREQRLAKRREARKKGKK